MRRQSEPSCDCHHNPSRVQSTTSRLHISPAIRLVKLPRGFLSATACLIMLIGRCLRRSAGKEPTADALCKAILYCAADVFSQQHNHTSPYHSDILWSFSSVVISFLTDARAPSLTLMMSAGARLHKLSHCCLIIFCYNQ